MGIDWDIPPAHQEALSELDFFKNAGIAFVQVEGVQSSQLVDQIIGRDMDLWVSSGLKFVRRFDFRDRRVIEDRLTDPLFFYYDLGIPISRYTMFEQPQHFEGLSDSLVYYTGIVNGLYDGPIDILVHSFLDLSGIDGIEIGKTLNDKPIKDIIKHDVGYLFISDAFLSNNPAHRLRELWSDQDSKRIAYVMNAPIFIKLYTDDPLFRYVVDSYTNDLNAVVALPPPTLSEEYIQLESFLYLALVLMFFSVFLGNISYQRSITRYFTNHNFFISDLVMKRIRSTSSVFFLWMMSLCFATYSIWILASSTINEHTMELIFTHYPLLGSILASGILGMFFVVALLIISVQVVTSVWAIITTIGKFGPQQVLHLLYIPHQVMIPVIFICVLFFMNTGDTISLYVMATFSMITLVTSFPIISIDLFSSMQKKRLFFVVAGPILYMVTVGFLVYWIFTSTSIPDTVTLFIQTATR